MIRLSTAILALGIALLSMSVVAEQAPATQLAAVAERPRLDELRLQDLQGQTHNLDDLRGKVVVVNFWAVWCQPCRQEMPSLERLRQHYADQPLAVVAVNMGDVTESIHDFLSSLKPRPQPIFLLDPEWITTSICGVRGLPTTLILDKRGRIAYQALGAREFDHPEIIKAIDRLLQE